MTEYLLPENEQYKFEGGWIEMFGMENFMKPGSADYEKLYNLAKEHKTIDGYEEGKGYIVRPLSELNMPDAESYRYVYYTLEAPKQVDQDLPSKLLVWFAPFHDRSDVPAEFRMFSKAKFRWPTLHKYLANNTYILRVADSSLHSGSFFQNTEVYPDYEERIQELIQKIASENDILQERTVLFGDSRGGTGAFIHGLIGGYKTIAVDPLMKSKMYTDKGLDYHLDFDFFPADFISRLNELLDASQQPASDIKIVSSANLENWPYFKMLHLDKFELLNFDFKLYAKYNKDEAHGTFTTETFDVALRYINEFLYTGDIARETTPLSIHPFDWDVTLPDTNRGFIFQLKDEALEITRTDYPAEDDEIFRLAFETKEALVANGKYRLTISVSADKDLPVIRVAGQAISPKGSRGKRVIYEFKAADAAEALELWPEDYASGWLTGITDVKIERI